MKKIIISMALAGLTASLLSANTSGFYGGISVGNSKTDLYASIQSGGSLDEKGTSYGAFFGYNINKYFATELNYNKFATADLNFRAGGQFTVDGYTFNPGVDGKTEVDVQSLGLSIIAKYPLHNYVVPYAKIGLQRYEHESVTSTSITTVKTNTKDTDKYHGFGIESNISKNFATRVSYENFSMDDETDVENYAFSLIYKF